MPNPTTPVIAPQKQMTGMLGHPVAENPIDRMFDAVYAHHGGFFLNSKKSQEN